MNTTTATQFPNYSVGTRVRWTHQFQPGVVTGHTRRGMPIVQIDGDDRGFAIHWGQLTTEANYQDLIARYTK
ncbi:hypothetical protein DS6A_96 [Mycobacterium phage DS6A]|uniref:Uncharacterized protein n=1 Tax=Mycobacterium phage DS6A TaxID=45764 RepID=G8I4K6_9CAUD|nr:hypothetical protein DS6A_96 [Mycobacterium phage DS6A]AER47650.1 hypothetical protein DS6A_96 [Mycobacterium phage DS6A]